MPNLNPFNRSKALAVVDEKPPLDNVKLIREWLHGRPSTTIAAYTSDIARLVQFTGGLSLHEITLGDLQAFADSLAAADPPLSPASQARILKACKSLLTFGCKTMPSYFAVNAGAALKLPRGKEKLAERILDEEQVQRIIAREPDPRNHVLLLLLYGSGIRREELCTLRWQDVQPSKTKDGVPTGQIVVFGKGSKTRSILLSPTIWQVLSAYRQEAPDEALIFGIGPDRVAKLVRKAAERAGIQKPVSPHWFRHAHASHALDNGAPISLVQQTLGHASIQTTGKYLHARPDESSGTFLKV